MLTLLLALLACWFSQNRLQSVQQQNEPEQRLHAGQALSTAQLMRRATSMAFKQLSLGLDIEQTTKPTYRSSAERRAEYQRAYRAANREKLKAWRTAYYKRPDRPKRKRDAAKASVRNRRWREQRPNYVKAKLKEWAAANPDKISEHGKRSYQKHKAKILAHQKARRLQTGGAVGKAYVKRNRAKINTRARLKHATDPNIRLKANLHSRLLWALHEQRGRKHANTMSIIGCSIEFLKTYLEAKFLPGMSWENYGRYGWHVDHIWPCASFDLTDPEQQKICFGYQNLQPLWEVDNLRKGATVPEAVA